MAKKKKRKVGNTAAKTMGWLRKKGYTVAKVERWNPFVGIRQDLFGFIDLIGIHPDRVGVLGVQTTATSFFDGHKEKLNEKKILPKVRTWLKGNNRVWLFGWAKYWKGQTERKIWAPLVEEVVLKKNGKLKYRKVEEIQNVSE